MAIESTLADATRSDYRAFVESIDRRHLAPLWEVLHSLVPKEPRSPCVPVGWHYDDVRPCLMESGRLITAEQAERRVLILENPARRGSASLTQSLYAGLQLLLPGEIAPSHRHSQSALRLVLEGGGAYTAVDGERTTMHPGDFIITPSMTWHDHGNPGDEPAVWLDGLDIPLVSFLDAGFAEKYPERSQPESRLPGESLARFGNNMVPMDHVAQPVGASPIFNYPYRRTRAALSAASRSAVDVHHGYGFRFVNPTTGGAPIPTIGAAVQLLPAGFKGRHYRSTDSRIFCCLEGEGRVDAGSWSFDFRARDVFVVPSWTGHRLSSGNETVLFSFSERPVQQALGLWREERMR